MTTRRSVVLVAMIVANAMILVDQTAVPLALPSIGAGLSVIGAVCTARLVRPVARSPEEPVSAD